MSLAKKVAVNTIAQLAGKALSTILSAVILSLIARYLQPEKFGFYTIALTILTFVALVADMGSYATTIRDLSQQDDPEKSKKYFGAIASFRFFFSLLIYVLAAVVVFFVPVSPILKLAFSILSLSGFLGSLNQTFVSVLHTNYKMPWAALGEICNRVVVLVLIFFAFTNKLDYSLVFWAASIGMAINLFVCFFSGKKYVTFQKNIFSPLIREFLKDSALLGVATFLASFSGKMDTLMLAFLRKPADVGIYGIALKVFETISLFPSIFVGMMIPSLSQSVITDQQRFKNLSQKTSDLLLIVLLPLVIIFGWGSPLITQIVGGVSFAQSALPMAILSVALIPNFIASLFTFGLISAKKIKVLFWINLALLVICLPLAAFLISQGSVVGAAISNLLLALINFFALRILFKKNIGFLPSFSFLKKLLLPFFIANLTAFILIWATRDLQTSLVGSLIIFGIFSGLISSFYLAVLKKIGLIAFKDRKLTFNF